MPSDSVQSPRGGGQRFLLFDAQHQIRLPFIGKVGGISYNIQVEAFDPIGGRAAVSAVMRTFCAVLICFSTAIASAQDTTYLPVRTQTGVRAVIESTTKWNPPIQPTFRIGAPSPLNPRNPSPPPYVENTLPLGVNSNTLVRGTVGTRFPGISATGWVPPDPNIGVGPNHIVEVVNSDIAWFDKATGVKQFQVGMEPIPGPTEGFFESLGGGTFVFDPKAFFDPVSQRFFVVALEVDFAASVSKVLVAVSDDNNPNGNWAKYRFEARLTINNNAAWLDYPGFGSNKDAVIVTGNMFGFTSGAFGSQALIIPKAPLLTGSSAVATSFQVPASFTIQVCKSADAALDKIYLVANGPNSASMTVFAATGLTGTPSLVSTNVAIPAWVFPFFYANSTGGRILDNLDGRILDAEYRAGKIYATHCVQNSQTDTRSAVRWYELNSNNYPSGSPAHSQSGNVVGIAGQDLFMPGIGTNAAGDVALVFTRSSTLITADVMVAGRKATDPPGTMGAPTLVKSSLGSVYGFSGFNRWGDYHSIEVDPNDNLTFWSVAMLGQLNGNWTTEISKLTISDITPGTSFVTVPPSTLAIYTDPLSVPPTQGVNLVGGVAEVANSDNTYATLGSVNVSNLGDIAALQATFTTNTTLGIPKEIVVRTETNVTFNVTGMTFLFDWQQNRFVQLKSFPLEPGPDKVTDASAGAPFARFVGPGGQVKAVFRALAPRGFRNNIGRVAYTLGMDQFQVRVRY